MSLLFIAILGFFLGRAIGWILLKRYESKSIDGKAEVEKEMRDKYGKDWLDKL